MPVTATPAFAQGISVGVVKLVTNDTTTLRTILTAGANGSLIDSIIVSSDDSSARDMQFFTTFPSDISAQNTLTSNGTNVSNNDTVTIGSKVYTFQTTLTNVDGNVKIGASATLSMTNLCNAINLGAGVVGTDYATAMTANTQVTATNPTTTTVYLRAITAGTAGNSIASTESAVTLSFPTTTLTGGSVGTNIDYLLCTISIPANSGFTNNISLVSILDHLRFGSNTTAPLGLMVGDPNGNKLFRLKAGEILKCKMLTTITTAKSIYIRASGADL
jgi:hypothetical protein